MYAGDDEIEMTGWGPFPPRGHRRRYEKLLVEAAGLFPLPPLPTGALDSDEQRLAKILEMTGRELEVAATRDSTADIWGGNLESFFSLSIPVMSVYKPVFANALLNIIQEHVSKAPDSREAVGKVSTTATAPAEAEASREKWRAKQRRRELRRVRRNAKQFESEGFTVRPSNDGRFYVVSPSGAHFSVHLGGLDSAHVRQLIKHWRNRSVGERTAHDQAAQDIEPQ